MENNSKQPTAQQPIVQVTSSGNKINTVLLIIILLVVFGIGAYLLGTKQNILVAQNQHKAITPTISQPTPTPESAVNWKVYENSKFGYSINYKSDWTYREFPDTQTGAGFRQLSSPSEIASECITVDEMTTSSSSYDLPFDEYVKKAATVEIQNYEKLNSIKKITAESGLIGYETTWNYRSMKDGTEKISLPITYFENKKTIQDSYGPINYKAVQIRLDNQKCESVYNQMLTTLKLTDQNQVADTSSWKTYANMEYGYSIKYPDNAEITQKYEGSSVQIAKDGEDYYFLFVGDLSGEVMYQGKDVFVNSLSAKDLLIIDLIQRCKELDKNQISWNSIVMGGISGFQAISGDACAKQYTPWSRIVKNNKSYSFSFSLPKKGSVEEYNQILSTFKFTN
jgi:hypothetical protein